MRYLNTTYKKITLIMVLGIIGLAGIAFLDGNSQDHHVMDVPTVMTLSGVAQGTVIDVLYRAPEKIFELNKTVSSEQGATTIPAPTSFLTPHPQAYVISTHFMTQGQGAHNVRLSTQTGLEISGLTPGQKIRIGEDQIPSDWAGRLVLNTMPNHGVTTLPLCLSWAVVKVCYSNDTHVKGGVS